MIQWKNFNLYAGHKRLFYCASFELQKGTVTALLGKNGAGKSTFLKTLGGFHPITKGNWYVNKEETALPSRQALLQLVSYVPVKQAVFGNNTLQDLVLSGNAARRNFLDFVSHEEKQKVEQLLIEYGLEHLKEHLFSSLSDGEQKLGLLAKAAFQDTDYLLLDEPEAFLDVGNRQRTFTELKASATRGKAVLFSTHQPELAINYVTHVAYIHAQNLITIPVSDYRPELLNLIFS